MSFAVPYGLWRKNMKTANVQNLIQKIYKIMRP